MKFTVTLYLYLIIEFKTRWFAAILYMLKWFAGRQIRNVGVGVLKRKKRQVYKETFPTKKITLAFVTRIELREARIT